MSPAPYGEFGAVGILGESEGREWSRLVSDALTATVLSYLGTAVVMPFEVSKVLLQVQWIPKEEVLDIMDPPEELPGTPPEAVEDDNVSPQLTNVRNS